MIVLHWFNVHFVFSWSALNLLVRIFIYISLSFSNNDYVILVNGVPTADTTVLSAKRSVATRFYFLNLSPLKTITDDLKLILHFRLLNSSLRRDVTSTAQTFRVGARTLKENQKRKDSMHLSYPFCCKKQKSHCALMACLRSHHNTFLNFLPNPVSSVN